MISKLSKGIVTWQIEKRIIKEEDRLLYYCGYELLLSQLVNVVVAILIGIYFHSLITVTVFLVSYIPVRLFAGGYHAKNNFNCTLVSGIILCVVCIVVQITPESLLNVVTIFGEIVAGVIIIWLAPVESTNKRLNALEMTTFRKRTILIWGGEIVIQVVLYLCQFYAICYVVCFSHIVIAMMLLAGLAHKNGFYRANNK